MEVKVLEDFQLPQFMKENKGFNRSIGGSSIASICGCNPWESRLEAWLRLTGKKAPDPENDAMKRGHTFEPIIAESYQATHPEIVLTHNNPATGKLWYVRDIEHDFISGQPDRIIHNPETSKIMGGLEIKTASFRNIQNWGEEGSDQVPENYLMQSQYYAGLMGGIDWSLIVWFFRPDDNGKEKPYMSKEYKIPFDAELFNLMRDSAIDFWEKYIVTDKEPPLEDSDIIEYVKYKFPRNIQPAEVANEEEIALMKEYSLIKQEIDTKENELELVKSKLQFLIGERDGITSDFANISWKCNKDSTVVDYRKMMNDSRVNIPEDVLKDYTTTKQGSRVFRFTTKKQKD